MSDQDKKDEKHKSEALTGTGEGGTETMPGEGGGEDEGSSAKEGNEDHLKEDQKRAW